MDRFMVLFEFFPILQQHK